MKVMLNMKLIVIKKNKSIIIMPNIMNCDLNLAIMLNMEEEVDNELCVANADNA